MFCTLKKEALGVTLAVTEMNGDHNHVFMMAMDAWTRHYHVYRIFHPYSIKTLHLVPKNPESLFISSNVTPSEVFFKIKLIYYWIL